MVFEPSTLHLRFRNSEAPDAAPECPPDVDAFLARPRAFADPGAEDELGVLPGPDTLDPAAPLVIFLQGPEFEIPAPGYDQSLPDLDSWSVRPTTFGWIASVPPPARGGGPRRAAQLVAGCLALSLPFPAHAITAAPASAPPPATSSATSPATTSATSKPPATPPTSSKAPASSAIVAPPAAAPTSPSPASTPVDSTTTPAASGSTPAPPPPRIDSSRAVADAAWEGIDGFLVVVELKGGKTLRGRIGAVQADTFTLIESTAGQILVIPKSGVASVRAHVPPPVPGQNGGGLIAGGSVLTALGVPVFLTGVVFVAICPSCTYLHIPMLVVGGAGLGAGIPMITRGIQRRTAFQKAMEEHRVVPMVSRTPYHGWTGGLQFRF